MPSSSRPTPALFLLDAPVEGGLEVLRHVRSGAHAKGLDEPRDPLRDVVWHVGDLLRGRGPHRLMYGRPVPAGIPDATVGQTSGYASVQRGRGAGSSELRARTCCSVIVRSARSR